MKVLLLGPYPPPHGGVQTNLSAIRDLLLSRGIPVSVINLHRHRTGRGERVYHPASALETLWLLLKLRYDVVHLHIGGAVKRRLLALALACALRPGARSVLTFHSGGYATSPAGRTARPGTLRGFVFRRFDRIIAVNEEIAALFARFGVPADRVRLIKPHALPAGPVESELPPPLEDFYRAHDPVLVTVGLLEREYDLPLQIEALGRVRERRPNAGLAILGSGRLEQKLRDLIATAPHGAHVLLTGDVPRPAALGAIARADVFLRTTLYDGDSVAVREALHLGTPVIATDNHMRPPGVRLIPVSNLDALCEAIEERLSAPRAPRSFQNGTAEGNVEAVLDLYRELTGAPAEARSGAA